MPTPLLIVAAMQLLILIAVSILLLRRASSATPQDARLAQVPDTLIRHEVQLSAIDDHLRTGLESLTTAVRADLALHRGEAANHALRTREELTASVARLSEVLLSGLESFRTDNRSANEALKSAVANDLNNIGQRLASFINEANRAQIEARDALHGRLAGLQEANAAHQESSAQLSETHSRRSTPTTRQSSRKCA